MFHVPDPVPDTVVTLLLLVTSVLSRNSLRVTAGLLSSAKHVSVVETPAFGVLLQVKFRAEGASESEMKPKMKWTIQACIYASLETSTAVGYD
jgi:hypothetical protein